MTECVRSLPSMTLKIRIRTSVIFTAILCLPSVNPISMLSYVGICDVNLFGAEFEFKYMRTYRCAVMQDLDRIKQLVSCLADGDPIRIKFTPGEDNSTFDTLHIPEKIELDA